MSPTEVPTYMKRLLCALMTTLLLVGMLPHAGLAISGQEALFGNDVPADNTSETGSNNATYPTLRPGDRDADDSAANIVFMQNRLIELGYLADSADGSYGESTEKAVLAFQRNNNLPETGVADTETQRKLFSDISTLVLPASDDAAFGGDLTRIQSILGLWGFYGGKIDGLTHSGFQALHAHAGPGIRHHAHARAHGDAGSQRQVLRHARNHGPSAGGPGRAGPNQ